MSVKTATATPVEGSGSQVTHTAGERFEVYSLKQSKSSETIFVKAGAAFVNRDGSINVYLDVLPLDGRLHIRRPMSKVGES